MVILQGLCCLIAVMSMSQAVQAMCDESIDVCSTLPVFLLKSMIDRVSVDSRKLATKFWKFHSMIVKG